MGDQFQRHPRHCFHAPTVPALTHIPAAGQEPLSTGPGLGGPVSPQHPTCLAPQAEMGSAGSSTSQREPCLPPPDSLLLLTCQSCKCYDSQNCGFLKTCGECLQVRSRLLPRVLHVRDLFLKQITTAWRAAQAPPAPGSWGFRMLNGLAVSCLHDAPLVSLGSSRSTRWAGLLCRPKWRHSLSTPARPSLSCRVASLPLGRPRKPPRWRPRGISVAPLS